MDILNGEIQQENKLSGFLSLNNDKLTGYLSNNETLVGCVVSSGFDLIGNLSMEYKPIKGDITIPPEIPTEIFDGDYTVIAKPFQSSTLPTQGLKMRDDIVILEIPYYETSNVSGKTVYIGG